MLHVYQFSYFNSNEELDNLLIALDVDLSLHFFSPYTDLIYAWIEFFFFIKCCIIYNNSHNLFFSDVNRSIQIEINDNYTQDDKFDSSKALDDTSSSWI